MSRWFRHPKPPPLPMVAEVEESYLKDVEGALLKLLDDDIAGADAILYSKESTYHYTGRGLSKFIAAMLSAEKDALNDAAALLLAAENKAWEDMKKAQKDDAPITGSVYPAGTEYLLCYSVAQLCSALCVVLSGNVTEAVRAFYKLRKAFLTVEGIMMAEPKALKKKGEALSSRPSSMRSVMSARSSMDSDDAFYSAPSSQTNSRETSPVRKNPRSRDPSPKKKPPDKAKRPPSPQPRGRLAELMGREASPSGWGRIPDLGSRDSSPSGRGFDPPSRAPTPLQRKQPLEHRLNPEDAAYEQVTPQNMFTRYTDIFIYSGTRLCYGLLLLVFSMITNPIFTKILSVVGFKGDRELGVRLLWQTTNFATFNSAVAGIVLLAYYNVMMFSDILPTDTDADEDLSGYPKARCQELLSDMRSRYPNSKLWKLEEARMHATNHRLSASVAVLSESCKGAQLKQIESLTAFELAFHTAFMHDHTACAAAWIKTSELSSWSPTLYAYMAASAHLELYRNALGTNNEEAARHKQLAIDYYVKAPIHAGKNRVMTKQIPFDIFCVNAIKRWEMRAKAWKCSLVDAIGVSPLLEMSYFWNGIKKMDRSQLERGLEMLAWTNPSADSGTSQSSTHHHGAKQSTYQAAALTMEEIHARLEEDIDERAVRSVLRASLLRNLGRTAEARQCLQDEVLCHDRSLFHPQSWTSKNAPYEMACICWTEKDLLTSPKTGNTHGIIHGHTTSPTSSETKTTSVSTSPASSSASPAILQHASSPSHKRQLYLVNECERWLESLQHGPESFALDTRLAFKITISLATVRRHRTLLEAGRIV